MANLVMAEPGCSATGDLSFFSTLIGGASAAQDQTLYSPYSLKMDTSSPATLANANLPECLADAGRRTGFWFRHDGFPAAQSQLVLYLNGAGSSAGQLRFETDGTIGLNAPGATNVAGTTVLEVNRWYHLGLSYFITSATVFTFKFYINGVLESTNSNTGTLTNTGTNQIAFKLQGAAGDNKRCWFSHIVVDDGNDASFIGFNWVTAKQPAANNTNGYDLNVGNNPSNRWENVNERPLSLTNGWEHRGVGFVAAGSLATNITTTTLAVTAPSCSINDILRCGIYGNNNQVVSPPDGTWSSISEGNNGTGMRHSIFWKRAVAGSSGATFNFTKPVDDNLLFAGIISAWKGLRTNATPIDATAASTSPNASSDTITYADYNPTESNAYVVADGFYANDLTTAGAMSGTDPTFTNRIDVETSQGNDCSIMVDEGVSSGAATGSRTRATTSTADAINTGVLSGMVPQAQENYTLQTAGVGDVNLLIATIIGRVAWMSAKASATTGSPTAALIDNGSAVSVTLTTSAAIYKNVTTSASYPSDAAGIGMRSTGTVNDSFLYECGTIIVFTLPITLLHRIVRGAARGVGRGMR